MTSIKGKELWRQGRIWISIVGIITAVAGWFVYDAMVAPRWMRSFGLEMAARATTDSLVSDETAFSTMRGRLEPDHPYICLNDVALFDWDRVFVVTSGGPIPKNLSELDWPAGDQEVAELNTRLASDARYQLIAFELDGAIVEYDFYFTIWADLSGLSRQVGFVRDEAVFLANSNGETYRLTAVASSTTTPCVSN